MATKTLFYHGAVSGMPIMLLRAMRPHQWIKNGFVVLPLLFARKVFEPDALFTILTALVSFCLAASGTYLMNDIKDIEADRNHPKKRDRPLAAGHISIRFASGAFVVIVALALFAAYTISWEFMEIVLLYLLIQLFYSFWLKHVAIIDIFCIAAGFFLRVIGGAVAIQVEISSWLLICTTMISMFLATGKRRAEMTCLDKETSSNHRKVLKEYDCYLLDQMINIITGCTILSYLLYCLSPEKIASYGHTKMIFTFPFVLYGIFRYLYILNKKNLADAPEKILLSDLPLAVSVFWWGLMCALIIYDAI